jgi:hypothetical protein
MLLNEVQQEQQKIAVQFETIASMQRQLAESYAELKAQRKDEFATQR